MYARNYGIKTTEQCYYMIMNKGYKVTIENQNTLEHAFKNGINLFLGAGFSTLAKDKAGRFLPVGSVLGKELADYFHKNSSFSLPQISTILESTCPIEYYDYLVNRFTVEYVDPLYYNILKLNVKSIYTTNIDNLVYRIYENCYYRFLNSQYEEGPSTDSKAINYLSLHGSVVSLPHRFVFDINSLANIYKDVPRIWSCLAREIEIRPTVFIGYGFGDSSVIQAITAQQSFQNLRKDIWVVLRNEDQQYEELYKSMGFNIIKADLVDFLEYLGDFEGVEKISSFEKERAEILKKFMIPHTIQELSSQRSISEFYGGSAPKWSDILSNLLYRTHHYSTIMNDIYDKKKKNLVIIGAPVSGKTTLMMQAAKDVHDAGLKLFFTSLSEQRAEYISKLIGNDAAVLFIDNLYDSIDAISILDKPNIKIVCTERSHNFNIISHLIDEDEFNVVNVTSLNDMDLQGIYNCLPESIRGEYLKKETELSLYGRDSVFEFVIRNVNTQNIRERYKEALKKLERDDRVLAEFLVLCAYTHSCHIPLSFEMAYDYFDGFNYNDIFSLKEDANGIIKDYIPDDEVNYEDMDYYYPRSLYIAEVILDACSSSLLKDVLCTFIANIPSFRVCDYRVFHKYAFDKVKALKAFDNWHDGKSFYEKAFLYDNKNPYVLQQGALYLAQKKQYEEAFVWIERARSMTDDKYFSIRNSHAIILFNANIEKDGDEVRDQLDLSMSILDKCMSNDSRKRFHANVYGSQSIKYYNRYRDEKAIRYLQQALEWLNKEIDHSLWDVETRKIRDEIQSLLSLLKK